MLWYIGFSYLCLIQLLRFRYAKIHEGIDKHNIFGVSKMFNRAICYLVGIVLWPVILFPFIILSFSIATTAAMFVLFVRKIKHLRG